MRIPRFYSPEPLQENAVMRLSDMAHHHARHVLRLKEGDPLTLFHQDGTQATGPARTPSNKHTEVALGVLDSPSNMSERTPIVLMVACMHGDKMDWVVQKCTELGVHAFMPLFTERSIVLKSAQSEKKQHHWQQVMISACEQSGRNTFMNISTPQHLSDVITTIPELWVASLEATQPPPFHPEILLAPNTCFCVGPEGGWSPDEERTFTHHQARRFSLGSQILRAETAAITLASCALWHDVSKEASWQTTFQRQPTQE